MTQQKPNPSAAADKPLSKKLEQIREAIFVWDKWLDKLNDAINEAKKLEAQQTDTLSELRAQIVCPVCHHEATKGKSIDVVHENYYTCSWGDCPVTIFWTVPDSAQTAKKEGPK